MSTPALHLETLFLLNGGGRILSTREPAPAPGSLFFLARGRTTCAWAVRADIPNNVAIELDHIAKDEPPAVNFRDPPAHAARYISLLQDRLNPAKFPITKTTQPDGPAFTFPHSLASPNDTVLIGDEQLLSHHFHGWTPGEISAGRSPMFAIVQNSHPVSICFCARRSDIAAEAGVETAAEYRGRGHAPRVVAAWAHAVRSSGRVPLYSTAWTNHASLALARKLNLTAYASSWMLQK